MSLTPVKSLNYFKYLSRIEYKKGKKRAKKNMIFFPIIALLPKIGGRKNYLIIIMLISTRQF